MLRLIGCFMIIHPPVEAPEGCTMLHSNGETTGTCSLKPFKVCWRTHLVHQGPQCGSTNAFVTTLSYIIHAYCICYVIMCVMSSEAEYLWGIFKLTLTTEVFTHLCCVDLYFKSWWGFLPELGVTRRTAWGKRQREMISSSMFDLFRRTRSDV